MKKLQNGYKGERAISITKKKIVTLLLAITFLFSIPVYAFADNASANEKQIVKASTYQNSQNSVNRLDNLTAFNDFYKTDSEFSAKASDVTNTSATISWSSETLYISYTVKQFNIALNVWEDLATTSSMSIALEELSPATKYDFQICSTASGEVLGEVSFTTDSTPVEQTVEMGLPAVSGACKTFAYYQAVTLRGSSAYAVLNSGTYNGVKYETYTDPETGIRMVDDCYCAALGSYYGREMGTKYKITLSTGKEFKIILCDQKADRHTDGNNQYAVRNQDIVEFYVERSQIPSNVRGSYNDLDQFHGDIVKIEKYV